MVANLFSALVLCLTFLSYQVEGNCPFGRWGKDCRRRCSSRCVGTWCEASTGKCKLGCVDRFYGDRCEQRCWNCGGFGRCYRDGRCIYTCSAGWARPICLSKIDCGQPAPITTMVVSGGRTHYGDRATYRCVSGYSGVGSGTSTCQESGIWTRPMLVCNKIDCGQPTPITNMVVSGGRTHYGDRATYRCVSGYSGVGSGTSTCQESGIWTRPVLVCNKTPCKDDYSFCQEGFVNCDAPGISEACKKTCGACEDTHAEPCDDPERWGWHCGEACSTACRERRCDRKSGHCLGECMVGHYGAACDLRCENCDEGGCFKNGTCRQGCRHKWRGLQCDQRD
ncbi:sushi, von Willebrand factor type A, EGF and pentraxin domain-containing protein 1-like isoform X1 [Haliotis rubra]|uniref:sushi, von Willebrand factor type A, EGF and pentraxin domain-containing protein 1-like isoform X1 n=1 Tax=Haliotis rubra TaxID=36100 RepID=UPI001EE5506F|nr:sushi, von Willebrand factor type A, EGF and pentraxin domain-containing protein 1-like isoform X1 [Haliotis rubra]